MTHKEEVNEYLDIVQAYINAINKAVCEATWEGYYECYIHFHPELVSIVEQIAQAMIDVAGYDAEIIDYENILHLSWYGRI